jgi:hypothetical protein
MFFYEENNVALSYSYVVLKWDSAIWEHKKQKIVKKCLEYFLTVPFYDFVEVRATK